MRFPGKHHANQSQDNPDQLKEQPKKGSPTSYTVLNRQLGWEVGTAKNNRRRGNEAEGYHCIDLMLSWARMPGQLETDVNN